MASSVQNVSTTTTLSKGSGSVQAQDSVPENTSKSGMHNVETTTSGPAGDAVGTDMRKPLPKALIDSLTDRGKSLSLNHDLAHNEPMSSSQRKISFGNALEEAQRLNSDCLSALNSVSSKPETLLALAKFSENIRQDSQLNFLISSNKPAQSSKPPTQDSPLAIHTSTLVKQFAEGQGVDMKTLHLLRTQMKLEPPASE